MHFSRRTDWNTDTTPLARALAERRRSGQTVVDLTVSNPRRCGIPLPEQFLQPFLDPAVLDYDPDPRGQRAARQAVAAYYAGRGVCVEPEQMVLTTGTSEAYSFLFRMLCDPGDSVLVPVPGYPLFDYLADAESVQLVPVPMLRDHGWHLDWLQMEQSVTPRTRAVILVHPNNPTGHFTPAEESRQLFAFCRRHGLALIVDEVFLDYALESTLAPTLAPTPEADACSFLARQGSVPLFVVSGISKILGLPQMKLAWIVAAGSEPERQQALERLEVLADTFLSVSTPVQVAVRRWLPEAAVVQQQIGQRIGGNLAALDAALAAQPVCWVSRLEAQAGWYAVLRIPALHDDEEMALRLLERGVWVHPGSFFSMPSTGWLVVSLLTPEPEFVAGLRLLLESVAAMAEAAGSR